MVVYSGGVGVGAAGRDGYGAAGREGYGAAGQEREDTNRKEVFDL